MKFICIPCVTPNSQERWYPHCAIVEAESEAEAAALASEIILSEEPSEPDYVSTIYVMPFKMGDFTPMNSKPAYEAAPEGFLCCGGPTQHSGYCPNNHDDTATDS